VEKQADHIPVVDDELNYVFEGCYTAQSNIKHANRVSENSLPEVEAISLVAGASTGFPYPTELLLKGWRLAMFNQFHDILPGSGIHATYEYAQGLFQEIQAIAGSVRTRALRQLAMNVDTSAASGIEPPTGHGADAIGDGLGAGAGDSTIPGGVTAYNVGAVDAEPVLVFNQLPFPRSGVIEAKIWNKSIPAEKIVVRDEQGNETSGQVLKTGNYWGHNYTELLFPVKDVPATGYKVYTVARSAAPVKSEGVTLIPSPSSWPFAPEWLEVQPPVVMENEFVRVEMDLASGAIKSLVDKSTGYEMVPEGELMGVLELYHEAPRGMSAWEIGQISRVTPLDKDGKLSITNRGPHRASVRTTRKVNDSTITVEVGLDADSSMVDFTVVADWLERGTEETGVPMLRVAFPTKVANPKATYEIPFGSIERPVDGHEVPALKWANISGARVGAEGSCGITLVNADKYGHSTKENTLRLTLLRSSFDPDPLPEMGKHTIRFAILPHDGPCSVSDAARAGAAFNLPMNVVSTDVHKGNLPPSKGYAEVLTRNVMLAGLKKAEDSDQIVVRLHEMEGKATQAKVRLTDIVKSGSPAAEVDLMEQPLGESSAKMDGDTLVVSIPAYGITTVMVGRAR
jgi:alpha-mannosidase